MRTFETTVYTFDELSDEAKQKALDNNRDINIYDEWYDGVYEMFTTGSAMLGIGIDKIYFSGFCSQGDGACFEGSYSYRAGWRDLIKSEFGGELEKVFIEHGEKLQAIQSPYFYKLSATVKQSGHYMHSGCTDVNVTADDDAYSSGDFEQDIKDELRNFMDSIYQWLEKEHDCLMTDETVKEGILASDLEFTIEGDNV